jgi:DNA-binding transcriptional ArsR family regulator
MSRHDPLASDALRVAVEPRRLQILQIIWDRELTVSEIAEKLPVSIAAVSQHLSKLRAAGLVQQRAEGRRRYYRATKQDMGALAVVLESFWSERLDALAAMARRLEREA